MAKGAGHLKRRPRLSLIACQVVQKIVQFDRSNKTKCANSLCRFFAIEKLSSYYLQLTLPKPKQLKLKLKIDRLFRPDVEKSEKDIQDSAG